VRPLTPSYVVSRARGALHACTQAWREGGAAALGHAVIEAVYWHFHPRRAPVGGGAAPTTRA